MKTASQNKNSGYSWYMSSSKNREYVHKYAKYNRSQYFNTIQFLHHIPSQFPPNVVMHLTKSLQSRNNPFTLFIDPYAGWGDRLIASMAMDIDYIGCDTNSKLVTPYKKMINFYRNYTDAKVQMYFKKSENVLSTLRIQKRAISNNTICITSPPFYTNSHKIVEEYKNTEKDYYKFFPTLLKNLEILTKICKWVCFHIPKNMYNDLKKEYRKCDKIYYIVTRTNKSRGLQEQAIYCWKGNMYN